MLFEHLKTMNYVGKFGNADPHFISDWIEVEEITTNSDVKGTWDANESRCTFASALRIYVFYQNIGSVTNP